MSRPLRIEYPGAWYHVMNRGRRAERIFLDELDFQNFIKLIQDASEMWHVNINSYCLMPNHYHMQINTPQGNLSRFMRHVDGIYTQTFNRRHQIDGSLFKGRFKSILIDADNYLLQLVRYIHRNPVRARLVKNLDEYPWSSHIGYLSKHKKWVWLYKDFVLSMLSDSENQRLKRYKEFVSHEDSREVLDLLNSSKWPAFWGSSNFIKWVKKSFYEQKVDKNIPESASLAPEISSIIDVVCDSYDVDVDELKKIWRGHVNESRNVAIYLIRMLRGDTLEKIGTFFGLNRYSSVGSVFQKLKIQMGKDKILKKRVDEIKEKILKRQT